MNLLAMNSIILLLILLLIVIVVRFIVPIIKTRISGLITWKSSYRLISLYLGILIMSVPILYMLPEKDFIKLVDNKEQAIAQSQNEIKDLFNYLHFDLNRRQEIYRLSSQSFKVDTKKVIFTFDLPNYSSDYQIFVDRKDVNDEVIEVSTYIASESVEGVDLSNLSLPLAVSFQDGTLSFKSVGHKSFYLRQFKPDFTVNQFKENDSENLNERARSYLSGQIIYIRIPKSLEIDTGEDNDRIQMFSSL